MLHVIVGDVTLGSASYVLQKDAHAYLVNFSNLDQEHTGTVYTSLGDLLGIKQLLSLLSTATHITYHPPNRWSDKKTSSEKYSLAWFTEHCLIITSRLSNIKIGGAEISLYPTVPPEQPRISDAPQLWVAGCSTTYGVGVDVSERYATLLSKQLNLPLSALACPAASNGWIADQILRSDIRSGDMVVFGVTTYNRFRMFKNQTVHHISVDTITEFPELNIFQLNSDTRIYESLHCIDQVINFCNRLGAKLIIIGIHANLELSAELSKYQNFVFCHGKFGNDFRDGWLDIGNDISKHPGPKTHQMYADLITDKAKQLDFV